jgi:sugar lactone lactonase YvrE
VIGQASMQSGTSNADTGVAQTPTSTSLAAPTGIAVNPSDGTLYVADSGNNRVLRFPRPVSQSGRITPDAVIGQINFTTATSAGVSASTLSTPGGLAIGPNGDLFVADTGNNRVLEFQAGAGNGASAIRVYGQAGFNSSLKPSQLGTQTLVTPQGVYVDQASNLYVTDTGANRALIFSNTQTAPPAGAAATFVIGQGNFSGAAGGTGLKTPTGIATDSNGLIYIADTGNNRVLIFPSLIFLPTAGGVASSVVGQSGLGGTSANWD